MAKKLDPIHPGEILLKEFMEPMGISQNRLGMDLGVPVPRINAIVRERRSITPDTALRLGRYFQTGPEVWLNLQQEFDLRVLRRQIAEELETIKPAAATG